MSLVLSSISTVPSLTLFLKETIESIPLSIALPKPILIKKFIIKLY